MKIEYDNLYIHFVFTTLHRQAIIPEQNRERIEKYITGIISKHDSHLYAIYANPDHVHFLVSRSPSISDEQLADIVATSSSKFINDNKLCVGRFEWQMSCSAFSISKSHINRVCKYILNQNEHHRKISFEEEYQSFIKHYQQSIKPILRDL